MTNAWLPPNIGVNGIRLDLFVCGRRLSVQFSKKPLRLLASIQPWLARVEGEPCPSSRSELPVACERHDQGHPAPGQRRDRVSADSSGRRVSLQAYGRRAGSDRKGGQAYGFADSRAVVRGESNEPVVRDRERGLEALSGARPRRWALRSRGTAVEALRVRGLLRT